MSATLDARPDGHGHVLTVGGRDIKFDGIFDAWGDELLSIAVWTHDLTDAEIIDHARAYLEGPFSALYGDHTIDSDEWKDVTIQRVFARWRPPTSEEKQEGEYEDTDVLWQAEDKPGDGLKPACVVEISDLG